LSMSIAEVNDGSRKKKPFTSVILALSHESVRIKNVKKRIKRKKPF
jgi:hypothetical protein